MATYQAFDTYFPWHVKPTPLTTFNSIMMETYHSLGSAVKCDKCTLRLIKNLEIWLPLLRNFSKHGKVSSIVTQLQQAQLHTQMPKSNKHHAFTYMGILQGKGSSILMIKNLSKEKSLFLKSEIFFFFIFVCKVIGFV